jgi:hypothetical protein
MELVSLNADGTRVWSKARNAGVTAPRMAYLKLNALATVLIT